MRPSAPDLVYGPVPSRRLGRSLGVDLVPFKTCSFDCVYCQLGRTTNLTITRSDYVPVDAVLDELREKLKSAPDYVGLAGSGEPTLHAGIGGVIRGIKAMTSVPVAVLTNGSLLWLPEVRDALSAADVVMPSLDAGDARLFARVNRPHPSIEFETMVRGLVDFTRSFSGEVWLEVLLVDRWTGTEQEVRKIAALVREIGPTRVQLNSVARPAADPDARAVALRKLEQWTALFDVPAEVVHQAPEPRVRPKEHPTEQVVLTLLGRRPCTVSDIAHGLGVHRNEVIKHLSSLRVRSKVRALRRGDEVFFEASRDTPDHLG